MEGKFSNNISIIYEKLDETRLDAVMQGFCENFAKHEAMGEVLKLKPVDLFPLFNHFISSCYKHSFVAIDKNSDEVVGALIANDYMFFKELGPIAELCPKVQAIVAFLTTIEAEYEKRTYIQPGKIIYQYAIYVEPKYGGNGIATTLLEISEKDTKKCGFVELVTIATGSKSQNIYRGSKINFRDIIEIDYSSFEYKEQHIFADLIEPKTCVLLNKKLNQTNLSR